VSFLEQGNKNDSKLAALRLMLEFGSTEDKMRAMREVSSLALGGANANDDNNESVAQDEEDSVTSSDSSSSSI
jgi:hypothetical protein